MKTLLIGWTTTENRTDAEQLAKHFIEKQWVACAQIEGPINSLYRWEGKIENTQEYRLTLKFFSNNKDNVHKCLLENHPYETPQWIVIEAAHVDPDYFAWVVEQQV